MSKPKKIDQGHYEYKGFQIIKDRKKFWNIYSPGNLGRPDNGEESLAHSVKLVDKLAA